MLWAERTNYVLSITMPNLRGNLLPGMLLHNYQCANPINSQQMGNVLPGCLVNGSRGEGERECAAANHPFSPCSIQVVIKFALTHSYTKEHNIMNSAGIIFVLAGLYSLAGAWFDWNWFMENRKVQFFHRILGNRMRAGIFYAVLGSAFVIAGMLSLFGVINLS